MELNQLHYFVTVAKTENITKAAQELYITQPALSRVILRLEKEIGTQLFVRDRGRLTLSDDGRLFLSYISPALDSINTGVHAITEKKRNRRICLKNYLVSDFFAVMEELCAAEFPNFEVKVENMGSDDEVNPAASSVPDVILIPEPRFEPYIVSRTFKEKWCVIYNNRYKFKSDCGAHSISLEQLSRESIIFVGSHYDEAFLQELFTVVPDTLIKAEKLSDSADFINRCRGVGIVPLSNFRYLQQKVGSIPISAMQVTDSPCERYLYLCRHPRFLANADDYALMELIENHIANEIADTDSFSDDYFSSVN